MSKPLHAPYAGKKLSEHPSGIRGQFKCAFCDKVFKTTLAASQHEHDYHKKMLEELVRDVKERETG